MQQQQTYPLVLVHDIDSSGLVFAHDFIVGPHGRADDEVVQAIAVQVAGPDGIAEVGADLIPGQVVQVGQVGVVNQDLDRVIQGKGSRKI